MKKRIYHALPDGQYFHDGLITIFGRLSKASKHLFNNLRHINLALNIITIDDYDEFSESKKRSFHRALQQLKKEKLVREVKSFEMLEDDSYIIEHKFPKHTYMLNPYLLRPLKHQLASKIWDLIDPNKTTKPKEYPNGNSNKYNS